MRILTIAPLLAAGLVISSAMTATEVQAQRFGAEIGIADDFGLGIGPRFTTEIEAFGDDEDSLLKDLRAMIDALYYVDPISGCDQCSAWEINANGAVPIEVGDGDLDVYVGGGLNVTRFSIDTGVDLPGFSFDASSTDLGVNLLGGLNFDLGSFDAFAEAGFTLGGGEQFGIKGGILVGGGGN